MNQLFLSQNEGYGQKLKKNKEQLYQHIL